MDEIIEGKILSAEQAVDLAHLQGMAGQGQPGPEAVPGGQPGQDGPGVDPVDSLAGLLSAGGMVAGALGYRRVSELWQPETCRGLSERVVPVLVKYPWGQRVLAFLTEGAGVEEIALAMYAAPLAFATIQAARADEAERRKAAKQAPAEDSGDMHAGRIFVPPKETTPEAQPVPDAAPDDGGMEWAR